MCNDLYGPVPNLTQSIIRRDVDLIGGCCSSDLCNKYNEPDKIPAPTMNPGNIFCIKEYFTCLVCISPKRKYKALRQQQSNDKL